MNSKYSYTSNTARKHFTELPIKDWNRSIITDLGNMELYNCATFVTGCNVYGSFFSCNVQGLKVLLRLSFYQYINGIMDKNK